MNNEELLQIAQEELENQQQYKHRIHICAGTGCTSSNSELLLKNLENEVKERGLEAEILVKKVGCMGLCAAGPVVSILPDDILYQTVTPEDAAEIIEALDKGPIERLVLAYRACHSSIVRRNLRWRIPARSTPSALKTISPMMVIPHC